MNYDNQYGIVCGSENGIVLNSAWHNDWQLFWNNIEYNLYHYVEFEIWNKVVDGLDYD